MSTNHQMNYYDYGKTLDIQGVMPVIGGGVNPDTHEYVDLGLSVKWATCNIGGNSPEEAGMYFAWGGTSGYTAEQIGNGEGKRAFSWDDYEFGPKSALTKYVTDGPTVLEPEDDAATQLWGSDWRMPTKEEFEELMTLPHTWDSSRSGYSFTDANENELLFVFAGGNANGGDVSGFGKEGNYWSSSLNNDNVRNAWELHFDSEDYKIGNNNRSHGRTVRPVRSQHFYSLRFTYKIPICALKCQRNVFCLNFMLQKKTQGDISLRKVM